MEFHCVEHMELTVLLLPWVVAFRKSQFRMCPTWVRKMVLDDATIEEVIHAAVKRVKRHETEETLVEVETLLNELTRSPEHARKVRDVLSAELVADVLKRGAVS